MPDQITTPQLETIQRLLVDPLRQTVRTEMQAGHDRLASAIEKVADQLSQHATLTSQNEIARDARIARLESRVTTLEQFRGRMRAGYTALVLVCSLVWEFVRDWVISSMHRK